MKRRLAGLVCKRVLKKDEEVRKASERKDRRNGKEVKRKKGMMKERDECRKCDLAVEIKRGFRFCESQNWLLDEWIWNKASKSSKHPDLLDKRDLRPRRHHVDFFSRFTQRLERRLKVLRTRRGKRRAP